MFRLLKSKFTAQKSGCLKNIRFFSTTIDTWIETLDDAQQKRVKFIQNELTLHGIEERYVPKLDSLTQSDYEHILALSTNQRRKYYSFLFKTDKTLENKELKLQLKRQITAAKQALNLLSPSQTDHIEYGLGKNTLLTKIYNKTTDNWKNKKAFSRILLNDPKIIFDCGYSGSMSVRENGETAKQLCRLYGLNRNHQTPFVLHFANMDYQSLLFKFLIKGIPTLTTKPLPVQIHGEDVCDLFPKEKLVVLTPDSPNILREYNPDDYYIISTIVDRGDKKPYSLAKAKKLELRTARLPLELFRTCRVGRILTLDQMMQVMLEVKYTGDWNHAFKFVAQRKFV